MSFVFCGWPFCLTFWQILAGHSPWPCTYWKRTTTQFWTWPLYHLTNFTRPAISISAPPAIVAHPAEIIILLRVPKRAPPKTSSVTPAMATPIESIWVFARNSSGTSAPTFPLSVLQHNNGSILRRTHFISYVPKWPSTPQRRNICISHCSIHTCVHVWAWSSISDLENTYSNAHSCDEYLCQISMNSLH